MKKYLLACLMLMSTASAFAYDYMIDGICYWVNEDRKSVRVTYNDKEYKPYTGSITIPSEIVLKTAVYPVTAIGQKAFDSCAALTSINMPSTITSIGFNAFAGCRSLETLIIPNSVVDIDMCAFQGCSGLTSVNIPNSVTSIGFGVFSGCSSLINVDIPNSVTTIGSSLFSNCASLQTVSLPDSMTEIVSSMFYNCKSLKEIDIPNTVVSINGSAFAGCASLSKMRIPDTVQSIGLYAFSGCTGLTSITIPSSVTSIASNAFKGCKSLTKVDYYAKCVEGPVDSDKRWFLDCDSIQEFIIGETVESIPSYLCFKLRNLGYIKLHDSITEINDYAFGGCSNLTSIVIPSSVTYLGSSLFWGCTNLQTVSYNAYNVNAVKSTWLGVDVKYFFIGDNVVRIPDYLCAYQKELLSISIPGSVASIGDYAFIGCTALESIFIDNGIETIGKYAFDKCSGLKKIDVASLVPPVCDTDAITGIDKAVCELYVPEDAIRYYKVANQWKDFYMILTELEDTAIGANSIILQNRGIVNNNNLYLSVYNTSGNLVCSGNDTYFTLKHGLYLVKLGSKVIKAIVE